MRKEVFSTFTPIKLTNSTEGDTATQVITGTAINYGSRSVDLGGYVRMFRTGCFTGSLERIEVFGLYAHEDNDIVARSYNGSLKLTDTPTGLHFEMTPPLWDAKFMGRIANGLVDKVSVGVNNVVDDWHEAEDGTTVREIITADLLEISFTSYPCFPDTSAELRMLSDYLTTRQQPSTSPAILLSLIQRHAEIVFGRE